MALVQRRFDRVSTLRMQQLNDLRAVLDPVQQQRFDRNVADDRKRAAESAPARGKP